MSITLLYLPRGASICYTRRSEVISHFNRFNRETKLFHTVYTQSFITGAWKEWRRVDVDFPDVDWEKVISSMSEEDVWHRDELIDLILRECM